MSNLVNVTPEDLIEGDIFELMGLDHLSDDKKAELINQLNRGIQSRVAVRIDDLLAEADKSIFTDLMAKDQDEETLKFLESKNINLGQLVVEETLLEKIKLIDLAKKVKSQKE